MLGHAPVVRLLKIVSTGLLFLTALYYFRPWERLGTESELSTPDQAAFAAESPGYDAWPSDEFLGLEHLCSNQEWDARLVFQCDETLVGGPATARNAVLTCIRLAIQTRG
jgi:hypothetical protein